MNEVKAFAAARPTVTELTDDDRNRLWARIHGEPARASVDAEGAGPADRAFEAELLPIDTRSGRQPSRGRAVTLAAAATVAIVGLGAIVAIAGGDEQRSVSPSAQAPTAPPASDTAVDHPTGSLLSTPVPADASPLVLPSEPGWTIDAAFGSTAPLVDGGLTFDRSTVFVGNGPMYDAPLFVATVLEPTRSDGVTVATTPSAESLLTGGEPVDVAGTTGAAHVLDVDRDSGLPGPVITLFWPLADGAVGRVNSVRLTLDEAVDLAEELIRDGDALTMPVPAGYRQLDLPPVSEVRFFSYQFAHGDRTLEVIGENRGVASLLGRIAGEVRTTEVVDGVEVASRTLPDANGRYWVDWLAGDWSYYVIGDGFTTSEEFLGTLSSLTLTDPASFEAAGQQIGIVLPGTHHDLAAQALGNITLGEAALDDAATTELAMSSDSYGFELFQGAACIWQRDLGEAAANNDAVARPAIEAAVEATITANAGTSFERAAELNLTPVLEAARGQQPQDEPDLSCPSWATTP